MLEIGRAKNSVFEDEREFLVWESDPFDEDERNGTFFVRVHPWKRKGFSEVAVEVGYRTDDGVYDEEPTWIALVDREEFVTGLLQTFEELERVQK